ncbi:efflux RND transporter periplasmic adaptor subunit [Fulvivirgaceae bacterium PWU4]|uniref:Efflux RND transporter periplasmic adaptor subunit n=1 Tax=Chryseosolibacter histidini TaxID=2782349 RepID=A0AAP2GQS9_9BACT|nr:efflux RND transporter periplasmic adaptor subunit [Chryseosolibacter histidini]MBT1699280.1 efflux RND transporter periplasmic adaptor subunit [Chryseosolibacter histidini]
MKRNWKSNIVMTALFLLLLFAAACNKNGTHAEHDTYTCPMHPTVIQDRPGTCPVCGMDLVRKARPGEAVEITEDLARLIKSPNETVVASIRTIKGEYKTMPVRIEAQGVVTYDTRNIFTIPSRTGGRLEQVFIKYPFQSVKKGQKVAEIYSPELLTAQRELLFLLENDAQNEPLINGAKQRLQLLGATESQIKTLIQRKEPQNTFAIYSPYDGYVIAETQQAPVAPTAAPVSSTAAPGGMSDGMGSTSASSSTQSTTTTAAPGNLIREGSYVTSGQTLFKVVNTSALLVELNLPSAMANAIKKGTDVKLDFGDGEVQQATVDFVQPFFNEGQEFLTVRVYTKRSDKLHIGHLVRARLAGSSVEALWIPREALLDLGVDKVVFIRDKKVLKPKKVVVGARTGDVVEIRQGLSSSDEIAANAQYLVDSESFIKTQK